ncbi:hypothetical protein [Almyronema epifaneia]|uniref:Glycosyltransferase n=1 Tax=Almyronema epifaneia S1 TaxID=2991925 RepID=A0ABW6IAT9_9CYAN
MSATEMANHKLQLLDTTLNVQTVPLAAKTVFYIPAFLQDANRHGGKRRSEQLAEALLESSNHIRIFRYKTFSFSPYWFCVLGKRSFVYWTARRLSLRGALGYLLYGMALAKELTRLKPQAVVVETAPRLTMLYADIVRKLRIPYCLVPHNIEFMVPGKHDSTFASNFAVYAWEATLFQSAKKVLPISSLDETVLKCLGANTAPFSYFPTQATYQQFQQIADKRQQFQAQNHSRFVLILGSAANAPNRRGIKSLLEYIKSSAALKSKHFKVAGHFTEQFANYRADNIDIAGTLDEETLHKLLIECEFVLLRQPQTTGFMTRLVELNLCGIPVVLLGSYVQAESLADFGIKYLDSEKPSIEDLLSPIPVLQKFTKPLLPDLEMGLT